MQEFNPQLHLLAIESNRDKIAELNLDLKKRIDAFIKQLKINHPLPDVEVLSIENGWRPMEQIIYRMIEHYLRTGRKDDDGGITDGHMLFRENQNPSTVFPQINPLLNCVGLTPEIHELEKQMVIVKAIITVPTK